MTNNKAIDLDVVLTAPSRSRDTVEIKDKTASTPGEEQLHSCGQQELLCGDDDLVEKEDLTKQKNEASKKPSCGIEQARRSSSSKSAAQHQQPLASGPLNVLQRELIFTTSKGATLSEDESDAGEAIVGNEFFTSDPHIQFQSDKTRKKELLVYPSKKSGETTSSAALPLSRTPDSVARQQHRTTSTPSSSVSSRLGPRLPHHQFSSVFSAAHGGSVFPTEDESVVFSDDQQRRGRGAEVDHTAADLLFSPDTTSPSGGASSNWVDLSRDVSSNYTAQGLDEQDEVSTCTSTQIGLGRTREHPERTRINPEELDLLHQRNDSQRPASTTGASSRKNRNSSFVSTSTSKPSTSSGPRRTASPTQPVHPQLPTTSPLPPNPFDNRSSGVVFDANFSYTDTNNTSTPPRPPEQEHNSSSGSASTSLYAKLEQLEQYCRDLLASMTNPTDMMNNPAAQNSTSALAQPTQQEQAQFLALTANHSVDLIVTKIRSILQNSATIRQALYYRLLRITQYLAWKFPTYNALQNLLHEVLQSKSIIGKQTTTVYMLGKKFPSTDDKTFRAEWCRKFLFTYRKNFRPLLQMPNDSSTANITSDQGWGCYIRTFQMMLAQCYSQLFFPSASDLALQEQMASVDQHGSRQKQNTDPEEREFVKELFVDNEKALFSVHNFCRVGLQKFNRKPGTWFGPFSAAKTIEVIYDEIHHGSTKGGASGSTASTASSSTSSKGSSSSSSRNTTFAHHCRVCVFDELFDPDEVKGKLSDNKAVICLLCKKLGPNANIAPEYTEAVKQVFKLATFQGLACGDTATSAHYFLAASDTYALYLDPHVETRAALDGAEMDTSSWHALKSKDGTPCLFRLPFESLNSSSCFCFLIRDTEDLAQLCLELEMYDSLSEAFEVKRGGVFMEKLTGSLDINQKWNCDDEDEEMVLL
ncbi:unnamed protein product [Amoebophrya sp. A120]|nr:unnamed protein product [Amoebophrya sp. A120]|eukprot:GSA120T00008955001.1